MKRFPFLKNIFKYILLVILTSLIFLSFVIAIPQTERLYKDGFNINFNDNAVWEKVYTLKITFQSTDIVYKWKYVNQTKDIIFERLKDYGVQFIQLDYKDVSDTEGELKVTVRTDKDAVKVEGLISQEGDIYLVTRKEGINFEDEKNRYAIYDPTNYDRTDLNRQYFRTIYVTQLKTTSGDRAYFGIFKTYLWKTKEYYKFMQDRSGQTIGLYIDGIVTPLSVPVYSAGKGAKPFLSIGLNTDKEIAQFQSIIFNNGKVPLQLELKEKTDSTIEKPKINTVVLSIIGLVSILITSIILYFVNKTNPVSFILSIGLFLCVAISVLKVSGMPINQNSFILLTYSSLMYSVLLYSVEKKREVIILTSIALLLLYITTYGVFRNISLYLLLSVLSYPVIDFLSKKYLLFFNSVTKK